jgi:hypothetical protein
MKILIACEESQAVTIEFRKLGHEAYSCDIEPCSGGHPEWHLQQDVTELLKETWDMIIAFPPCTYLTNAGAVRLRIKGIIQEDRMKKAIEAKEFFMQFYNSDCEKVCIENPTPGKIHQLPTYSQAIQPWMFGHPYTKRTCLWLRNLPKLEPTSVITEGVTPYVNGGCKDGNGNYRRYQGRNERDPKTRSKTFPGIAKAMAQQWGGLNG